jgi:hypothetical protein
LVGARRHGHGEDPSSINEGKQFKGWTLIRLSKVLPRTILDSSDEDTQGRPDAMPGIATQRSAVEDGQHVVPSAQSIEDPLGAVYDENFTFDDAFQNYLQDSFLAFGGDQENIE